MDDFIVGAVVGWLLTRLTSEKPPRASATTAPPADAAGSSEARLRAGAPGTTGAPGAAGPVGGLPSVFDALEAEKEKGGNA